MPTMLDDQSILQICSGISDMLAELQKANEDGFQTLPRDTFAIMARNLKRWNAQLDQDAQVDSMAGMIEHPSSDHRSVPLTTSLGMQEVI